MTDFADRHFDSLPGHLRRRGYHTVFVGRSGAFDHQEVWLEQWYAEVLELLRMDILATDKNIFAEAAASITRHDQTAPEEPLFALITSNGTHYPFPNPLDDPEALTLPDNAPLLRKYHNTLGYTDRRIGWFVNFLETRSHRDHTLLVVVGDHAFYTDLAATSGLPENDTQWTGAIFHGPGPLLGPPRRVEQPASHVDLMPTILALVGDTTPTAALGRDLLGAPRSPADFAIAVRQGGIRIDRAGYQMIIDRRSPGEPRIQPVSPGLGVSLPTPDTVFSDHERSDLYDFVDTYSYLIEHDRVWSPRFLAPSL